MYNRPQIDMFPIKKRTTNQRHWMALLLLFLHLRLLDFRLGTLRGLLVTLSRRLCILLLPVFDTQPKVGIPPLLILQPQRAIVNPIQPRRFAKPDPSKPHRLQCSNEVLVSLRIDAPFALLYHLWRRVGDLVLVALSVGRRGVHGLCHGGTLGVGLVGGYRGRGGT